MNAEQERAWLSRVQGDALASVHEQTTFPMAALILWNPADPECYSIVGNAPDEVHAAIVATAYGAPKETSEPDEYAVLARQQAMALENAAGVLELEAASRRNRGYPPGQAWWDAAR